MQVQKLAYFLCALHGKWLDSHQWFEYSSGVRQSRYSRENCASTMEFHNRSRVRQDVPDIRDAELLEV